MTDQKSGRPPATPRPRQVTWAIYALAAAAIFSLLVPLAWSSQRSWVTSETIKANKSAAATAVASASKSAVKKHQDVSSAVAKASASFTSKAPISKGKKLDDAVSGQTNRMLISDLLILVVLAGLAYGAWRGRYWVRWGVTGFFILGTVTNLGVSLVNLLAAVTATNVPGVIRTPLGLSTVAMIVAVVLVNLRPAKEYFALSRPQPPAGAPQRRGLFAPRPATANRRTSLIKPKDPAGGRTSAPVEKPNAVERAATKDGARSKKRANAESVARGAELARNRAKASKSRRTER